MKIALLFPGYGSQFVGMGKELYDEYRIVQEYFEEASHVLETNFIKLCFASSDAELSKLEHAYTSLFLIGASVHAVLQEQGIHPDVVLGYNDGESTALFAAGCFSLPDGLYLLHKFCSFYEEVVDGMDVDCLRIAGVATAQLEKACQQMSSDESQLFIAIYNSPMDHIVAGSRDQLAQLHTMFEDSAIMEYVGTEVGLHSPLMNNVVNLFKDFLEKVDFKDLKIPLISGIDGALVTMGSDTKERFISHINSPLEWFKATRALADYDCILVVIPRLRHGLSGQAGDDMCTIIKEQYPDKMVLSISTKEDIEKIKKIINVENENTGLTDGN